MLGQIVDWLSRVEPAQFWVEERRNLILLAAILALSPLVVALFALLKYQTLLSNFPMRLRWNFHRLMLGQSMSFYQDEFAGRVATKVMQTALAVRDAWITATDILAFITIYFVTMLLVVGSFDLWMLAPFLGWLALYAVCLRYFVPRLGKMGAAQADARSLMTGRITDAYTNIATVKLFSHASREAGYARSADAGIHADRLRPDATRQWLRDRQPRAQHGAGRQHRRRGAVFWTKGQVGIGAVAAASAMALRLNGISHWIMWEVATLFEHIGTVQDGIRTLSRPHTVLDKPGAPPLRVQRGEIRFDHVSFGYGGQRAIIDDLCLHIRPGEKIGLVGRSGAGKSTIVNLLLRFYDVEAGAVTDRRAEHRGRRAGQPACAGRHGHPGHVAAASLGARQHRLRSTRCDRRRDDRSGDSAPKRTNSSSVSRITRGGTLTTRTSASVA